MKIKSVKGKIATGVVAATLLGSSTFAFANTNAGAQFKIWGENQIAAAKAAVSQALAGNLQTAKSGIDSKATADKNAAEGRINQAGTDEKADTKSKIETKLAEHIQSLQDQLAAFMLSIGGDFGALVTAENNNTTSSLNSQYAALSTNITTVLNSAKDANVKDVTEQSLLVKGQATSDLIKEINRVKKALADEVASQQTTANSQVTAHLNSEVIRINGQLDALIGGLETNAKAAITAAGQSVEDSAIANFDRVISLTQTETPIKVDPQKLNWVLNPFTNGKAVFKVTNTNEFDVVFRYKFIKLSGQTGGVSETPYAESVANAGETSLTFDADQLRVWGVNVDVPGWLSVDYLDENGQWKNVGQLGN
jgi:hypothetical protein